MARTPMAWIPCRAGRCSTLHTWVQSIARNVCAHGCVCKIYIVDVYAYVYLSAHIMQRMYMSKRALACTCGDI